MFTFCLKSVFATNNIAERIWPLSSQIVEGIEILFYACRLDQLAVPIY